MAKEKDIQLRSEELHEIIGKVPNILTRFGSFFIFLVLLSLVGLSAVVKYPDVVYAPFEISTANPPIPLYAKTSGNIEQLLKQNGDAVELGDLLVVMENEANEEDIFLLEQKIDSFINSQYNLSLHFSKQMVLGRLQESYALFNATYENYLLSSGQHVGSATFAYINNQIGQLKIINQGLLNQKANCQNELQSLQNNYNQDVILRNKGILSERELTEKANVLSQKVSQCQEMDIAINNNNLRIHELELQQYNVSSTDNLKNQNLKAAVKEKALKLKSDIDLWKNQYMIIAPASGFVSLNEVWSNNQYVESGKEIVSIVQENENTKITAQVQGKDIAKLKIGQQASLNLEAYNYLEFGYLKATVSAINSVPRDNLYTIELSLENNNVSTYQKELSIAQGMQGTAEIVSEQRTLLSRVFDKFRFLVHKKYE